jgi:hypothetical protein
MPVNRIVTVNLGAVSILDSEFLLYTLYTAAGSAIWAFGCIEGSKLTNNDIPQPPCQWHLGVPSPSSTPGLPHLLPDRPKNDRDRYVVNMSFAGVASYRLLVVKKPKNTTIQDISYQSNINTDSYVEPLAVTLI